MTATAGMQSTTCRATSLLLTALALLLLLALPERLNAQDRELARIDSLIAATRLTEARTALAAWQRAQAARARPGDAALALLLRGRLATNADTAIAAYLEVALGYPSSAAAPEALLRLGQAALAMGDAERAAGYLTRLTRDYPAATQRTAGDIWLARALLARRRTAEACSLLENAQRNADAGSELRPLIAAELNACRSAADRQAAAGAAAQAPAPDSRATTVDTSRPDLDTRAGAAGTFAVQVGAFRDERTARQLADRLRRRGFVTRVAFTGSGTLAFVRAGTFTSAAAAAPLLRRLRTLHPDAVIVADAARERTAR